MSSLLGAAAAALLLAAPAAGSLFDSLADARFLNAGVHRAEDNAVKAFLPVPCMYLEPENVTVARGSWGGACNLLYLLNSTNATSSCNPLPPTPGYDRPGGDYKTIANVTTSAAECEAACCDELSCMAWVYAASAPAPFMTCQAGESCCYLKGSAPDPKPLAGLVSGAMNRTLPTGTAPPIGARNSVPLGGVGAGAVELRGDGSFHEWTIVNQSPAGAAKFGVVGDAWLAVRAAPVGGGSGAATSRMVRTAPPSYAAGSGVPQITYSGSYPLSRLVVEDPSLPITSSVYGYSTLVPGNVPASAYPAAIFTLAASNPSSTAAVNVSWAFALPFAAINDCARLNASAITTVVVADYGSCLQACSGTAGCASWTFTAKPGSGGQCVLNADVPLSVHSPGSYCGVQGGWSSDGLALNLAMHPAGGAGGPANGDVTLRPVLDSGAGAQGVTLGFAVADDPAALWNAFSTTGSVGGSGMFTNASASIGAASVSAVVPPGGNITLTIVFSWYFPDRDHMGEAIGNGYATLWDSSDAVARELAQQSTVESVVDNLNAHHSVYIGPDSSLPQWLGDMAVNQMSHFRGLIYTRDGRLREFEAFDCPDMDSVHNDYQRHLPYLWVLPEFELSKFRRYASGQSGDGHINEYLGSFNLGPFDVPGGRVMGDTTTLWLMELLELWRNTGDESLLLEMWPAAQRAVRWQIAASAEIGLPLHLVCTYDIIDFQQYNTTTFNAMLHLGMMKAAMELASHVNDTTTYALAQQALTVGQAALQSLLWNSSHSYFRAYTGGDAVMADCLYGQVVALNHGLGWLVDPQQLGQHLEVEWQANGNDYGLAVVTGRVNPPPRGAAAANVSSAPAYGRTSAAARSAAASTAALAAAHAGSGRGGPSSTIDDVNWMGAGPDWSYIALTLGAQYAPSWVGGNITAALEPARLSMENWRSRLNSMWDIAGITTSGDWGVEAVNGQPYVTSHYGFMLVDYYLLGAMSGQMTDLPHGKLSFAPLVPCPFNLPVGLFGGEGTVQCDASGTYTLALAFGQLTLPAGGLSVNGKAYPAALDLVGGQSVSW